MNIYYLSFKTQVYNVFLDHHQSFNKNWTELKKNGKKSSNDNKSKIKWKKMGKQNLIKILSRIFFSISLSKQNIPKYIIDDFFPKIPISISPHHLSVWVDYFDWLDWLECFEFDDVFFSLLYILKSTTTTSFSFSYFFPLLFVDKSNQTHTDKQTNKQPVCVCLKEEFFSNFLFSWQNSGVKEIDRLVKFLNRKMKFSFSFTHHRSLFRSKREEVSRVKKCHVSLFASSNIFHFRWWWWLSWWWFFFCKCFSLGYTRDYFYFSILFYEFEV